MSFAPQNPAQDPTETASTVDPAPVETPVAPEPVAEAPQPDPAPVVSDAPAETPAAPEPAQLWQFVDVISGEYAGVYGVYVETVERVDGKPVKVLVRARDHGGEADLIVVDYSAIKPSARTGGR